MRHRHRHFNHQPGSRRIRPINAEVEEMRKITVCLLVAAALIGGTGYAKPNAPGAPEAQLSATSGDQVLSQVSRVLVSTWGGEDYDASFPPIHWPRVLRAPVDSDLSVVIATSRMPEQVEVRIWRRLKKNGVPEGKPILHDCTMIPLPQSRCLLSPVVFFSGAAWKVSFPISRSGHAFIATLANWSDAQVVWINHLKLEGS